MKLWRLGSWIFQVYYPTFMLKEGYFNVTLITALGLSAKCIGIQVLGFGFGIGYFPVSNEIHDGH